MGLLKREFPHHPFVQGAHDYANSVIDGHIVACDAMKKACKRFQEDWLWAEQDKCPFYFDLRLGNGLTKIQENFEHPIGNKWKTKNITLEPWQQFFWANVYGWYWKDTKATRFKTILLLVGRGNGKTVMAAQAGLTFLSCLPGANGNFVYTAATIKKQAELCLKNAITMADKNPEFCNRFHVKTFVESIRCKSTHSQMEALSGKVKTLDGLNAVLINIDEVHKVERPLYNVLSSGMRKRDDSVLLLITTAGEDITGPGFAEYTYGKKLLDREFRDEYYFPMIFELDDEDKQGAENNPNCWIKSNPNLGVSINEKIIGNAIQKAKHSQAELAGVKVKHFNIWNQEASQYFNMGEWDLCADPNLNPKDFLGQPCYVGWDLASVDDLAAIAWVFLKNGIFYAFEKCYLPQATLKEQTNDLYKTAAANGELNVTPGKTFNSNFIKKDLLELKEKYIIKKAYYDSWNALDMVRDLEDGGYPVEVFYMKAAYFTAPMKKVLAKVRNKEFRHNGSKLFRWCMSNVEAKVDYNDNVFPRKKCEDQRYKIDAGVAVFMAMRGWITEENKRSVYEDRGMIGF